MLSPGNTDVVHFIRHAARKSQWGTLCVWFWRRSPKPPEALGSGGGPQRLKILHFRKNLEETLWRHFFWRTPEFLQKNLRCFCAKTLLILLKTLARCVLGLWPWAFLFLASRESVLGKSVLGLGLASASDFLCPWPWPRALCPRLYFW